MYGYTGTDKLYGGRGRDQLGGQQRDDTVNGGADHDFCSVETIWADCEVPIYLDQEDRNRRQVRTCTQITWKSRSLGLQS